MFRAINDDVKSLLSQAPNPKKEVFPLEMACDFYFEAKTFISLEDNKKLYDYYLDLNQVATTIADYHLKNNRPEAASYMTKHAAADTHMASLCEQLIDKPDDLDALKERAKLYFQQAKWALAIRDFENLLTLIKDDVIQKKLDEAKENLKKENFYHLIESGKIEDERKDKNNFESALAQLNQAIQLYPKDIIGYLERGRLYLNNEKYDLAIQDFNIVLTVQPKNATALLDRSLCYLHQKKYKKTIRECNRMEKSLDWGQLLVCQITRGHAYYYQRQYVEACRDYNEVLLKIPSHKEVNKALNCISKNLRRANFNYQTQTTQNELINLAYEYLNHGQWTSAINHFNLVIKSFPDHLDLYIKRGEAYLKNNQFGKAIEDFSTVLKKRFYDPELFAKRGEAYLKNNQFEAAVEDFNSVLKNLPFHLNALKMKVKALILSSQWNNDNKLNQIISSLNKIQRSDDKDFDLMLLNYYREIRMSKNVSHALGDKLEKIIKSKSRLNLIEKYNIKIPHIFNSAIAEYRLEDLESREIIKNPTTLRDHLVNYNHQREIRASRDNSSFHSFFARISGMSAEIKISSAEKVIQAIDGNKVSFTSEELRALQRDGLGNIMNQYGQGFLKEHFHTIKNDLFSLHRDK